MLTTNISLVDKYQIFGDRFQKAYAFLRNTDFSQYDDPCEIEIDGRDVYAQVQIYDSKPASECRFEAHHSYFDIQFIAEGEEYMGYMPANALETDMKYDPEKDIEFFRTPASYSRVLLQKGDFATVSPDDGHMPRCMNNAPCRVKKVVVKVRAYIAQ